MLRASPILTTVKTQLRRRPDTSRQVSSFITSDIYVEKMQYIVLALFRWKFWHLKCWYFITSLWNIQIEDIMSISWNYCSDMDMFVQYMHRFVVTLECWVIDASYHLWMFVTHALLLSHDVIEYLSSVCFRSLHLKSDL